MASTMITGWIPLESDAITIKNSSGEIVTADFIKNNTTEENITEGGYISDWDNYAEFRENELEAEIAYYTNNEVFSLYPLTSAKTVIGMPLHFMPNVDMRVGGRDPDTGASIPVYEYGKQFTEDILYDMCVAVIKVGGPSLNGNIQKNINDSLGAKILNAIGKITAIRKSLEQNGFLNTVAAWYMSTLKTGGRFYSFMSDFAHYTHYVNTLAHLFANFLGIGNDTYTTAGGMKKKYIEFSENDETMPQYGVKELEANEGNGLRGRYGFSNAVYLYISDAFSNTDKSFGNTTTTSSLESTVTSLSDTAREYAFFAGAAGLSGLTTSVNQAAQNVANSVSTIPLLGRLFGPATEGLSTIIGGNRISLPKIYEDSSSSAGCSFKVRLVSPYGDPESVFWYVLLPLARILAFSMPRQYGMNSYQSPFIVQAFSKGVFNCQLGIVNSITITRGGNGGESYTIANLPTELDVSIEIEDMYEKVFLSNEYYKPSSTILTGIAKILDEYVLNDILPTGNGVLETIVDFKNASTAYSLLFNNIGLLDFAASFCGFNLNVPTELTSFSYLQTMINNRGNELVDFGVDGKLVFPQATKIVNDAMNRTSQKLHTLLSGGY